MGAQFDLEQGIMNCWNIVEDIQVLKEKIESDDFTRREMLHYLQGLEIIYHTKFDKLFGSYEQFLKERRNV